MITQPIKVPLMPPPQTPTHPVITLNAGMQQPFSAIPAGYNDADPNSTAQTVNPNELVGNQLQGLIGGGLDGDSQYIKQAIAQSEAQSAGRGLLNSSMAAGAGENAAISAALPIANAQAQQYAQVGAANQQAATAITGANIAADASTESAGIGANASMYDANVNAATQKAAAAQQFQEYGMGLGYQYAQLGQQGQQFSDQLKQNATQFTQQQNTAIGEFQNSQSFAQYQIGMQQQMNTQNNYAQEFASIMANPNMTADERAAALANSKDFFTQETQFNANIPAFTPSWISDPNYWSNDWTGGG